MNKGIIKWFRIDNTGYVELNNESILITEYSVLNKQTLKKLDKGIKVQFDVINILNKKIATNLTLTEEN